tara:strand:- start:24 stop:380 length:357 start_codon:yes stop_codon:yes gene_type:complete
LKAHPNALHARQLKHPRKHHQLNRTAYVRLDLEEPIVYLASLDFIQQRERWNNQTRNASPVLYTKHQQFSLPSNLIVYANLGLELIHLLIRLLSVQLVLTVSILQGVTSFVVCVDLER